MRCRNQRSDSPHNRYVIDPRELVRIQREAREREQDIVGFYHSHPEHPARWSQTDLARGALDRLLLRHHQRYEWRGDRDELLRTGGGERQQFHFGMKRSQVVTARLQLNPDGPLRHQGNMKVLIPTPLRHYTDKQATVELDPAP